jgi:hypothetical protein
MLVLTIECIVYLYKTKERVWVPWIMCVTPTLMQIGKLLTFAYRSVHVYAMHRLLLLAITLWSLSVWYTTLVDTPHETLFLLAWFSMIIAAA